MEAKTQLAATEALDRAMQLDRKSKESEAIIHYVTAIKIGLSEADLRDALICLASSLRNVGRTAQAGRTIARARRAFPDDPIVLAVAALIRYDSGDMRGAVRELGLCLLREAPSAKTRGYAEPLGRYFRTLGKNGS
ncbi:MAG: tetratricopeptide repeat protein [Burkholderiaceae bacterium]|nr:tetratricopeptide repeat protein [Burkholderiaceae bacterium]